MAKRNGARSSATSRGDGADCPDAGDLVWLSFTPQAGREQAGRRPGLVLSPRIYNAKSGLCLICPVTSQIKGYPFEVELPEGLPIDGVILADHVRSADWRDRRCRRIASTPPEVVNDVRAKIRPLIGL